MKKKTLAIIISLAMMATAFCGMTVTASADESSTQPYFGLYVTDQSEGDTLADGDTPVLVGDGYTAETFAKLASKGDPVGAYYQGKGSATVIKSTKYVTMNEFLAKYKLSAGNIKGLYAVDGTALYSKGGNFTKYLNGGLFYGKSTADALVTEGATQMPFALSITYAKTGIETTAEDVLKANIAESDDCVNFLTPSLDEGDIAGKRIPQGIKGVAVNVDEQVLLNATKASVKVAKGRTTVTASNAYAAILKAEGYQISYKYYAQKKGTSKKISFNKVFKKGAKNKYYKYKVEASVTKADGTVVHGASKFSKYYKFKK